MTDPERPWNEDGAERRRASDDREPESGEVDWRRYGRYALWVGMAAAVVIFGVGIAVLTLLTTSTA